MLNTVSYNSPSFKANIKSPKLQFCQDDFFIRIRGYGRDTQWADLVKKTADEAVKDIREHWDSDWVLFKITQGVKEANQLPFEIKKRKFTGILRTNRSGWDCDPTERLFTYYDKHGNPRYRGYAERLDKVVEKPLKKPYEDIDLTRPVHFENDKYLLHADGNYINNALKHVEKLYQHLQTYKPEDVHQADLKDINNTIATIRWVLAHATPWLRGSDAISNVFMKALYKSFGIKTIRPAKGISFDMEAFCTKLEEYRKKFPSFFASPPKVIEE